MKHAALVALYFVDAQMLTLPPSLADVLRCKIEGHGEDVFITTSPDTNSSDGRYGSVSRGASAIGPLLSPIAWGLLHSLN